MWGYDSEWSLRLPEAPSQPVRKPGLETTVLRVDKTPGEGSTEAEGLAFREKEEMIRARAGCQGLSILCRGCH